MKKLSLKPFDLNSGQILNRSQLKRVFGGNGSGDDYCDSMSGGCPPDWHPEKCLIDPNLCPMGTLICVPIDQGCKYYLP